MSSGRLGALDLAAATNTLLYTCPEGVVASVSVNFANRGVETPTVRLALIDGGLAVLSSKDYVEYDSCLCGSFERTGLLLSEGQSLVVWSSAIDVSVQAWGWEEPE